MQEQVTAEEIILAVVENMHQSLEPLLFSTWAPSLYHVYLRRGDYERLRGLFPAVIEEAKTALDRELEALNGRGGGGALRRVFKKEPEKRYLKPKDGWNISFSVDDDLEDEERYRVEVLLVLPPKPDFGPGHQTIRVTTSGNSNRGAADKFKTRRVVQDAPTDAPHAASPPHESPPPASPPHVLPPSSSSPPPAASPSAEAFVPRVPVHVEPAAPHARATPDPEAPTYRVGEATTTPTEPVPPSASVPTRRARTDSRAPSERVYATFTYEDQTGRQEYQMKKPQVAIGRGRVDYWVDIKLKTKSDVSHEHARVRYDERTRSFYIKDLSTFGTKVNGFPIPSSVEKTPAGEKRDKDVWVPLPARSMICLADVFDMDFRAEEEA